MVVEANAREASAPQTAPRGLRRPRQPFKPPKFPFDPSLSIEQRDTKQGYKRAGDLHSESGIMDEMKCMKCLGSGLQFTGALAAKEECLSFPDSDPRLEKEQQQQQPEGRCFFTCSKPPAESHSPRLGKTRDSAAKGSGAGPDDAVLPANHNCTAGQSDKPLLTIGGA